ncbi:MAG: DUF433 domain-containing protein [Armatimonadetes bacterium]|nr:DUF433 domain-containing protein [Armatimonadota bacterium]
MPTSVLSPVEIGDDGIARIKGSRIKVIHIARERLGGWTPEEIQAQHPHLSMSQIHAALSYY